MVKTINITLDDDVYKIVAKWHDESGLTWPELLYSTATAKPLPRKKKGGQL